MAKSKTKDLRELYGNLLGEDLVQKLTDDQINLLSEYYNSLTEKEKDKSRSRDFQFKDYKWLSQHIQYMKSFFSKVGDKLYVAKSPDGPGYHLWLEDPTDPKSKADPRNEADGMSFSLSEDTLISMIGEDHFNYIKTGADKIAHILAKIKRSGYGEWQFRGDDVGNLDMYGFTSEYLK